MPTDQPEARREVYIVGDLWVDVGQQRVLRGDRDIPLPNLSFQLLVALVQAAPDVLSDETLMARVWPGLIVNPETVKKRVKLLRDALGDEARDPRYVAGVRSRGYRLVASVSRAEHRPAVKAVLSATSVDQAPPSEKVLVPNATDADAIAPARRRYGRSVHWGVALGLMLAVAIGVGLVYRPFMTGTTVSLDASSVHTVAVLPFDSISAEASDGYLAQGVPEMILNRLSHVEGLAVIARTSSFALPTKTMDSRDIGRRLNSGYLVGGSVQREGDRLRVNVQLVHAPSGLTVWSSRFDRPLKKVFDLEDEICDQLADAIALRTGGSKPGPIVKERSHDVEAYLAFLKGRTLLGRFTVPESEAAVPYFEKAIRLDPQFAPGYASLYDAHMQAADGRSQNLDVARERYRPLIEQALAIDPQSGSAYFARAMWGSVDVNIREEDFRRGVALDPSNGRGLTAYADFLKNDMPTEKWEECQRVLHRALQIDPMSPSAHFMAAVWATEAGISKTEVVERKVLDVLELDPNFVPALDRYGKYRWLFDGKFAEAIALEEHAIALDPDDPWIRQKAMAIYLDLGDEVAAGDVAAGTPGGTERSKLLRAMYRGDWRAAGLAALGEAAWNAQNVFDDWQAGEALRDYAMRTGEWARCIGVLEAKYNLSKNPRGSLALDNFRQAYYVSQLLEASGQRAQALELRRAVAAWNDAHESTLGSVYARRLRAAMLLADGDRSAALSELAASFRSGDYEAWWYTLQYDPVWVPLHDDPRFKAIAKDVGHYVEDQRSELETLRRKGLVPPRRPTAATAAAQGMHYKPAHHSRG
jgi:TolB-like protein/DNA-binding winged helix-turn-helix (wHTH) protein/Tfp pilus assembly protein PilF